MYAVKFGMIMQGTAQNFEFTIHAMVRIVGGFVDQNMTNNKDMVCLVTCRTSHVFDLCVFATGQSGGHNCNSTIVESR